MKEQPKTIFGSLKEYDEDKAARRSGKTISKAAEEAMKNKQPIYGSLKEHDEAQHKKLVEAARNAKINGLQFEIKIKKEEKQNLFEQIKKAERSKDQIVGQAIKALKIKLEEAENKIRQFENNIDTIKYPNAKELIVKKRKIEVTFSDYKNTIKIYKEKEKILNEDHKTIEKIKDKKDEVKESQRLRSKIDHLESEIAIFRKQIVFLEKELIDSKFFTEDTLKSALEKEEKFKNRNAVKEIFEPYLTGQAA